MCANRVVVSSSSGSMAPLRGHDGGDSADLDEPMASRLGSLGRKPEDASQQRHYGGARGAARLQPANNDRPPMCSTSWYQEARPTRTIPSLSQSS